MIPFCDLAETRINGLYGVGSIHDPACSAAVIKKLLDMQPVANPNFDSSMKTESFLLKAFKFSDGSLQAGIPVNLLQMACIDFLHQDQYHHQFRFPVHSLYHPPQKK